MRTKDVWSELDDSLLSKSIHAIIGRNNLPEMDQVWDGSDLMRWNDEKIRRGQTAFLNLDRLTSRNPDFLCEAVADANQGTNGSDRVDVKRLC